MPSTKTRVEKVATVIIPVNDQEAQIAFYTEKLGFQVRTDVPFGNGERWVEVTPADDAETTIALAPPGPNPDQVGGRQTGISLYTEDIDGYHAQLRDAGVDVDAEVSKMGDPVPPLFWFRDAEDNTLMVVG